MITLIKYGVTKNLGDYNSERIDAEYQLSDTDCPNKAMANLKHFVNTGCVVKANEPSPKTTTETKVDEDVKLPETPVKTEEEKKPAQKVTKKAAKKTTKKATGKKVTPKANIVYSRDEKTHKDELSKILSEEFPNWKTELLAQAKALSGKLVGTDIYSFKGELLDSFKEAVTEGMTCDASDL